MRREQREAADSADDSLEVHQCQTHQHTVISDTVIIEI